VVGQRSCEFTTYDPVDHGVPIDLADTRHSTHTTIAQDGGAVGESLDFL
jgi:hypothetical protein